MLADKSIRFIEKYNLGNLNEFDSIDDIYNVEDIYSIDNLDDIELFCIVDGMEVS